MAKAKLTKSSGQDRKLREIVAKIGDLAVQRTVPLYEYWRVGDLVERLGRAYGGHEIEAFTRATGRKHSVVYLCLKFRQLWPNKTDVDRLARRGLGFTHVSILMDRRLTAEERERLVRVVQKRRLSTRELREMVRRKRQ